VDIATTGEVVDDVGTHDDVLATRRQGVPRTDDDATGARRITTDVETTRDTPALDEATQRELLLHPRREIGQVGIRQDHAAVEPRTIEALELTALDRLAAELVPTGVAS